MAKLNLNDADVDMLIDRFREIFFDKYELEDKVKSIVQEEIRHLPTKDEFYEEASKMHKKQQDLEDEKDVLSHQVSRNYDNISFLARKLKVTLVE